MPAQARITLFLASVHLPDGTQLTPPQLIQCLIKEPIPHHELGEWEGILKLDPALEMVFQGCELELRVCMIGDPRARVMMLDGGKFAGLGPPPGWPAWRSLRGN